MLSKWCSLPAGRLVHWRLLKLSAVLRAHLPGRRGTAESEVVVFISACCATTDNKNAAPTHTAVPRCSFAAYRCTAAQRCVVKLCVCERSPDALASNVYSFSAHKREQALRGVCISRTYS